MAKSDDFADAIKMMAADTGDELGLAMQNIMGDMINNNAIPRDAMGVDPSSIEGMYAQAYHHYNAGKYKEAARLFHLLQMLDGMEPKYPLGLGACYHMLEEYQNALTLYAMVCVSDPENPVPHYHASDCYVKMELVPAAIAELQMAMQLCGGQPQYAMIRDRSALTIKSLREQGTTPEGNMTPNVAAPEQSE